MLVSILIPAYNAEEWISDTLRSALAQTWRNKEIIVVDDGSADATLTVARRFECSSIKVVSQSNQGASAARNTALSLCQGEYIQWLDADDVLSPEKIEIQIEAARRCDNNKILLSSAWAHFFHRVETAKFRPSALWGDLSPLEWLSRKMEHNLHMPNFSFLVSRELTHAAGSWDRRLTLDDDGEYFCRVLLASEGVHFVPEAQGFYRRSSHLSQSQIDGSGAKLQSQLLSLGLHIRYLTSLEDSDRIRRICLTFLQRWFTHFYPERTDLVSQLEELAAELGGHLEVPHLSWKYRWIQRLFGWKAAKGAQSSYNRLKSSVIRTWDRASLQSVRR